MTEQTTTKPRPIKRVVKLTRLCLNCGMEKPRSQFTSPSWREHCKECRDARPKDEVVIDPRKSALRQLAEEQSRRIEDKPKPVFRMKTLAAAEEYARLER